MEALRERGLVDAILGALRGGAHLFGVCVGMQLLFARSEEGETAGLGLLPGTRDAPRRARGACRTWAGTTSSPPRAHPLTAAFPAPCYFAHTYAVQDAAPRCLLASTPVEHGALREPRRRGPRGRRAVPPRALGRGGRRRSCARSCAGRAMLRKRIIPCLDVSDGRVVKGVNFVNLRDCGEPVEAALRYAEQGADEIVWLNITATGEDPSALCRAVERAAEQIDIPLTVGGGVNRVGRVRELLLAGADKVSLNTARAGAAGPDRRGRRPLRLAVRRLRDRRPARARRRLARLRGRRPPADRLGRDRLGARTRSSSAPASC